MVAGYDLPLVSFGDQVWTIHTFLTHFTPGRYTMRARDRPSFDARLANVVALVVRDAVLLDMAMDEDLEHDETLQRTLTLWKRQWMFQEYRSRWVSNWRGTESEVEDYYRSVNARVRGQLIPFDQLDEEDRERIGSQLARRRLAQHIDSLAGYADVWINAPMLDTLAVNISPSNPTVHLFKSNSNKMPFPIADPNWRGRP